jgi:hypothetical protein
MSLLNANSVLPLLQSEDGIVRNIAASLSLNPNPKYLELTLDR